MAETIDAPAQETTKTPGNIVSAGPVGRGTFPLGTSHPAPAPTKEEGSGVEDKTKETQEAQAAAAQTTTGEKPSTTIESPASEPYAVSDKDVAEYLKSQGIEYESLDKLKEKLSYTPPVVETPEQKAQALKEFEKRQLEVFGGTVEEFTLLKQVANSDPKELGLAVIREQLKQEKFSDEEINDILKESYYQITDEEIELEDDDKKEALRKKKAIGDKKLEATATQLQSQAKSTLENLTKAIQETDAEKANMELYSSKVGESIKTYQRKETFQLEDGDGQEKFSVEYDVPETVLTEVQTILQNPKEFEKQLLNEDGSPNLDFLLPVFVKAYSRDHAVQDAFKKGQTREVEKVKGVFSSTPPELGGNKKTVGTAGNIVSAGQPEVMKRPT